MNATISPPAPPPVSGGESSAATPRTIRDLQTVSNAIARGWNVPAHIKAAAVRKLGELIELPDLSPYVYSALIRTAALLDSQDIKREKLAQDAQQGNTYAQLAALRLAITASPDTAKQLAALSFPGEERLPPKLVHHSESDAKAEASTGSGESPQVLSGENLNDTATNYYRIADENSPVQATKCAETRLDTPETTTATVNIPADGGTSTGGLDASAGRPAASADGKPSTGCPVCQRVAGCDCVLSVRRECRLCNGRHYVPAPDGSTRPCECQRDASTPRPALPPATPRGKRLRVLKPQRAKGDRPGPAGGDASTEAQAEGVSARGRGEGIKRRVAPQKNTAKNHRAKQ